MSSNRSYHASNSSCMVDGLIYVVPQSIFEIVIMNISQATERFVIYTAWL